MKPFGQVGAFAAQPLGVEGTLGPIQTSALSHHDDDEL
jgi:hypothetical protein